MGAVLLAVVIAGPWMGTPDAATGQDTIAVTVTVNGSGSATDQVRIPVNATAFQALNASHTVNYTTYDFGRFVTGIDGMQQNDTHSWLYVVNGSVPGKAVDRLVVDDGATVSFVYMSNEKAMNLTG